MDPKSPTGYDKLSEGSSSPKSPKSPKSPLRPFRLKFHRMLSTGSLKLGSTSSPGTPSPLSTSSDGKHYSFDCDSVDFLRTQSGLRPRHGVAMKKINKKKKCYGLLRRNKKRNVHGSNDCTDQMVPIIKLTLTSDDEGAGSVENLRPNSLNSSTKVRIGKFCDDPGEMKDLYEIFLHS